VLPILLRRIEYEFNSLQTTPKDKKPHGSIEHIPQLNKEEEQELRRQIAKTYSEHKRDRIRIFKRGNATVIKVERNNEQRRRHRERQEYR